MTAVTVHGDFGAQEEEICHCFQLSPFYLPNVNDVSQNSIQWTLPASTVTAEELREFEKQGKQGNRMGSR